MGSRPRQGDERLHSLSGVWPVLLQAVSASEDIVYEAL